MLAVVLINTEHFMMVSYMDHWNTVYNNPFSQEYVQENIYTFNSLEFYRYEL